MQEACSELKEIRLDNFGCSKNLRDISRILYGANDLKCLVMPCIHIGMDTEVDELIEEDYGLGGGWWFQHISVYNWAQACAIIQYFYSEFLVSNDEKCSTS